MATMATALKLVTPLPCIKSCLRTFFVGWQNASFVRNYATAPAGVMGLGKIGKKGKIGPAVEKKILPYETDPHKLVAYVCGSNYKKEGEDIKIKPDSEYPDWLWTLRTGPAPPIEELDKDSKVYHRRFRRAARREQNRLMKLKQF